MLNLHRSCLAAVGFERGLHAFSNILEARTVHIRSRRVWLKKVVPNVGAGNINIRPDLVQDMVLRKVPVPDLFVPGSKLVEYS
jgi:hypothetical protein